MSSPKLVKLLTVKELRLLEDIVEAAEHLVTVKGSYNKEVAFNRLAEAVRVNKNASN